MVECHHWFVNTLGREISYDRKCSFRSYKCRCVVEGDWDFLHSNHHGTYWYIWWRMCNSLTHVPYSVRIALLESVPYSSRGISCFSESKRKYWWKSFWIVLTSIENFLIIWEHKGMMEEQACRVFIEVFKSGLGNGFQQRNTYILKLLYIRHQTVALSIKPKYSKSLRALTIFSPTISITLFRISEDV
jgi:hypothetical protein